MGTSEGLIKRRKQKKVDVPGSDTERRFSAMDGHIGNRLRLRRMMLNMSQTDLGAIVGVTFQQIQKYEHGFNRISAARLFQFAGALGVPLVYFFENAPDREQNTEPNELSEDALLLTHTLRRRDGVALMKAYMRIKDPRVRQSIVTLVQSVAGEEADAKVIPADT